MRIRLSLSAFALSLLTFSGCKPKQGTTTPDAATAKAEQGVTLRYSLAARELEQTTAMSLTLSGLQTGEGAANFTAKINLSPLDQNKLKFQWQVLDIASFDVKGALKPEGDKPQTDAKTIALRDGSGVLIADARGKTDKEASKPFKKNQTPAKPEEELGRSLVDFIKQSVDLANLPEAALVVGKPLTVTKKDSISLQGESGPKLPVDIEIVYLLKGITSENGQEIAELLETSNTSGVLEAEGQTLVLERNSESTLRLNTTTGTPVSSAYQVTTTISFGNQNLETMEKAVSTYKAKG